MTERLGRSGDSRIVDGNEAVSRICDEFQRQGIDPHAARSLSFVTWEELVRTVVTAAGEAEVFEIEWPEEAQGG